MEYFLQVLGCKNAGKSRFFTTIRKQHFFEGMQKKYRQNLANQEKILERVVVKMYENTNIKCSFDRDG